jgi:hypothetical protein
MPTWHDVGAVADRVAAAATTAPCIFDFSNLISFEECRLVEVSKDTDKYCRVLGLQVVAIAIVVSDILRNDVMKSKKKKVHRTTAFEPVAADRASPSTSTSTMTAGVGTNTNPNRIETMLSETNEQWEMGGDTRM